MKDIQAKYQARFASLMTDLVKDINAELTATPLRHDDLKLLIDVTIARHSDSRRLDYILLTNAEIKIKHE